jgi:predicted DNA binding CopG/RHH family protein
MVAEKALQRASQRKKKESATSPSQKISIRLPKPLLDLLREQAAQYGTPYQTFIKTILYDIATGSGQK